MLAARVQARFLLLICAVQATQHSSHAAEAVPRAASLPQHSRIPCAIQSRLGGDQRLPPLVRLLRICVLHGLTSRRRGLRSAWLPLTAPRDKALLSNTCRL